MGRTKHKQELGKRNEKKKNKIKGRIRKRRSTETKFRNKKNSNTKQEHGVVEQHQKNEGKARVRKKKLEEAEQHHH